jgi:hypothetical protein
VPPEVLSARLDTLPRLPRDEGGPLFVLKGLSDPATPAARKEAWAEAFRHTPHGMPVDLAPDSGAPDQALTATGHRT